ncbi:hypothetical protein QJQ45_013791 [Haematococcus lacustris]|nr:hypothetical protein QJQ45_013791 [Haematococcus lacustris]
MALRQLRGLARTVLSSKLTPERGGAGAPIKLAPRPDRPVRACGYYQTCIYHAHSDSNYGALQLPLWYELWWDNGVFPGQLCCDFMAGPMTCNLTEAWYAKAWSVLSLVIALPIMYHYYYVDEFRHPMVPEQYPEDVRRVLMRARNTSLLYDYSQPNYEEAVKARRKSYWTPLY